MGSYKKRIYLDYAICVPHGERALMRRHFSARCLTVANMLEIMEVYGPLDIDEWLACHEVFTTMCIGWDAISGGWLRAYGKNMSQTQP